MSQPEPAAAVVWWKTSLAMAKVPRQQIGWCDAAGSPHGAITILSPHPRLDRRTVETALAQHLAGRYREPPRLATAEELADQLSVEAQLRAAGYRVLTRDLTGTYGSRALGGVVATLLGRGIRAYVLIDDDATGPARTAVCYAAEEALRQFQTATPDQLHASGWERGREERWQLLLQQR